MERRIKVEKSVLREVYKELKEEGFSLDNISDKIDSSFRNHLYSETKMSEEVFHNLVDLIDREIDHEVVIYNNGVGEVQEITLERNELLAELVGIILGDGHLSEKSYSRGDRYITNHSLTLTFHSGEEELIERAIFLTENCIGKAPALYKSKHSSAVHLKIHGKEVVEALKEVGLTSGNKVENQVSVPEWIKSDKKFAKACLRGLVDTDGSIYERGEDGYIVVHFKNRSKPLLSDFEALCALLDIRTSSAGQYAVQVAAQKQVENFIDIVDPIKSP